MPPTSVNDIDLTPIPGKTYTSFEREWREEFIYFLMVDRFHDDANRPTNLQTARTLGFPGPKPDDFYGGTIKGITRHLDYIAGLGCTAIWVSPVFENNAHSYHGYDIRNYLNIDPNFGTKQDLVDLVDAAHARDMRVILDVVINHSGDNWFYLGHQADKGPVYAGGRQFAFGDFRSPAFPIPIELRNQALYHRQGRMQDFDTAPERLFGDIETLKDYENDDDPNGSVLINILIKVHSYWIREADVDGFRVDAVKHMGPLASSRFASNIREYAYALGKRRFFLFGEVASPSDDLINAYIGANTSALDHGKTVFFGLDSILDFRLAEGGIRDVIKGFTDPKTLFDRLDAQRNRALNRGEIGNYLVTFVDNHDAFWQRAGRIGAGAPQEQIIAAIGFILCALGTPVLYYGTEQGFQGKGGDNDIREAMFDRHPGGHNLMNPDCTIYQEIAKIAKVMRDNEPLRFGRMYYRQISGDGVHFGFPSGQDYTLAFSRMLYPLEVLVAYNVAHHARNDAIVIDSQFHKVGESLKFLYGGSGTLPIQQASDGALFVRPKLAGRQFVILG